MSSAANCVVNWQKAGGGGGGAAAVSEVEWENYWNPRLYVENAIGELKLTTSRCVKHDGRGLATVCQSQHINGTFFEFMELNKFPFDSQASHFRRPSSRLIYIDRGTNGRNATQLDRRVVLCRAVRIGYYGAR